MHFSKTWRRCEARLPLTENTRTFFLFGTRKRKLTSMRMPDLIKDRREITSRSPPSPATPPIIISTSRVQFQLSAEFRGLGTEHFAVCADQRYFPHNWGRFVHGRRVYPAGPQSPDRRAVLLGGINTPVGFPSRESAHGMRKSGFYWRHKDIFLT
jgi:hypothetical protein